MWRRAVEDWRCVRRGGKGRRTRHVRQETQPAQESSRAEEETASQFSATAYTADDTQTVPPRTRRTPQASGCSRRRWTPRRGPACPATEIQSDSIPHAVTHQVLQLSKGTSACEAVAAGCTARTADDGRGGHRRPAAPRQTPGWGPYRAPMAAGPWQGDRSKTTNMEMGEVEADRGCRWLRGSVGNGERG